MSINSSDYWREHLTMVADQIDALLHATGLSWDIEGTGGGCDALVAYFEHPADIGKESPRLAYAMLTSDLSVPEIGVDSFATLGWYDNAEELSDAVAFADFGDEYGAPMVLAELVDFVAETLNGWGFLRFTSEARATRPMGAGFLYVRGIYA